MREASRRDLPWRVADVLVWYVVSGVGMVAILVAWYGSSGSVQTSSQLAWANVGVAGVIAGGAANVVWLISIRRALSLERDRLVDVVSVVHDERSGGAVDHGEATEFVALRAGNLYHRPNCQLVVGKDVVSGSPAVIASRRPCGMCKP